MKAPEWSQRFSHKNSIGIFRDAQGQLTHKSMVRSCRISNQSELLWLSSLPARIKKNQLKMKELEWSQGFTIKTQWELSVAMETRFWSDLAKNLMQSIPHPNDAPDGIWLQFASWSQEILMFESVDSRRDGRRLESHTISCPWVFGSGEPKKNGDIEEVFTRGYPELRRL